MAKEWNSSFLRVCLVEQMTVKDGVSSLLPFQDRAQSTAVTAATVLELSFSAFKPSLCIPWAGQFLTCSRECFGSAYVQDQGCISSALETGRSKEC